jgi:addiction module HigA family antidote
MASVKQRYPHDPDYTVAPGGVLQDTIDALGMSQADLAVRTGLSKKTINQIIRGREPLSHDTALRLERVTGTPARLWNNLEAGYRERLARLEEKERLVQDLEWLKTIPTGELIRRRAVEEQSDRVGLLQAVLVFFGVNSPREWSAVWNNLEVVFRKSRAFEANRGAVAAWIRLGEVEAQRIECQPFDKDRFKHALDQIRVLTVEGPEVFVPRMQELCAAAGVAVVFTPEIKGAPVSGATQWLTPDKALIQLTLRHKSNDHFWFSFFHEAGHILKHGKKEKFVEDGAAQDERETEANRFAEDFLIPRERVAELTGLRGRDEIISFAQSLEIPAGIVVGRLQRMRLLDYRIVDNGLKDWFRWSDDLGGQTTIVRA